MARWSLIPTNIRASGEALGTVVEAAIALTVNPSQQSVNNPTPATWTLSSTQAINLQNGNLTVLAPLQGPGGITKGDGGHARVRGP